MELKKIEHKLTVCKVADTSDIDFSTDFYFVGKTDEELSLVERLNILLIKAEEENPLHDDFVAEK